MLLALTPSLLQRVHMQRTHADADVDDVDDAEDDDADDADALL